MNATKYFLAALCAGAFVAMAGPVLAAPLGGYPVAVGDRSSDSNLRWASVRIEQDIDMLQRDRRDYAGHRADAVGLLRDAQAQITLGLSYDNGREDAPPAPRFVRPDADMVYLRGGSASDENLVDVRHNLEDIASVLERDNYDYEGHRSDAVWLIDRARYEIDLALRDDASH